MRVFITGATGFVGSAVVDELLGAGHTVVGLARSRASAAALEARGAEVYRGSLEELDTLSTAAATADAVIHTAFNHDFSRFMENCELDRRAILALGDALAGSDKPLLVTSGVAQLADDRVATEADEPPPVSKTYPRASEAAAAELVARGVRASTVRLAPSVHGEGDHGFVPYLIDLARRTGVSVYIGDGDNRWPGVHRLDAAALYRLAVEQPATDARYHATADEGVAFRDIAEVIGRRLGVPVTSQSPEEAQDHFGWMALFAAMDMPAASEQTRSGLGWQPGRIGLLADLDQPYYFDG